MAIYRCHWKNVRKWRALMHRPCARMATAADATTTGKRRRDVGGVLPLLL
jgi:hypothetical protein